MRCVCQCMVCKWYVGRYTPVASLPADSLASPCRRPTTACWMDDVIHREANHVIILCAVTTIYVHLCVHYARFIHSCVRRGGSMEIQNVRHQRYIFLQMHIRFWISQKKKKTRFGDNRWECREKKDTHTLESIFFLLFMESEIVSIECVHSIYNPTVRWGLPAHVHIFECVFLFVTELNFSFNSREGFWKFDAGVKAYKQTAARYVYKFQDISRWQLEGIHDEELAAIEWVCVNVENRCSMLM